MKNILKSMFVLTLAVLGMASCSSNEFEYEPAIAEGMQVFFPGTLESTLELNPQENALKVPVMRAAKDQAASIPMTITLSEGSIFSTTSATAEFAAGSDKAEISLSYDPTKIQFGKYEDITISVAEAQYQTPYGLPSYSFKAGATAWVEYGKGLFRDGLVGDMYGQEAYEWQVTIEKNTQEPGMYRIVAPYATGAWKNYYKAADAPQPIMVIDATDPDYVYVNEFNTGVTLNSGDGEMTFLSYVQYYLNGGNDLEVVKKAKPDLFGKMKDGVIEFPAKSFLAALGGDGYYYGNNGGMLRICMPGIVPADYTAEIVYAGRTIDVEENEMVKATVTLGPDVASAKIGVLCTKDANAVVSAILKDEVETVTVNADGTYEIPFDNTQSGTYTIAIVTFDAEGNAQEAASSQFKYTSSSAPVITWSDLYLGDYKYTLFFGDEDEPSVDEDLVLSVNDSDPTRFKISEWGYGVDFCFTMDGNGNIMVDDQETGYVHPNYGSVMVDDLVDYSGTTDRGVSYYDSATGTFHFNVIYYVEAGNFGYGYETFQLTAKAQAKVAKAMAMAKGLKTASKVNTKKADLKVKKNNPEKNMKKKYELCARKARI